MIGTRRWIIHLLLPGGKDGENIALIPPLEFKAPEKGEKYFYFDLTKYPAATVAAVCIDTAEGELRLPYDSALGIAKIIKNDKGTVYIYFGNLVPEYQTGRVYFAQGASGLTQYQWYVQNGGILTFDEWKSCSTVTEAPKNGKLYARCDGKWVEINATPAPSITDSIYYGYVPAEVLGETVRVADVTVAMLNDSRSHIVKGKCGTLGKTSIGTVPAGALAVVMIPAAAGLVARKFDGISGWMKFSEDNGTTGTGANGTAVVLSDTEYLAFGEFKLIDAEIFIGIE